LIPPDPVTPWLKDYLDALGQMGGKGLVLGTDTNGISPQITATDTVVVRRILRYALKVPSLPHFRGYFQGS